MIVLGDLPGDLIHPAGQLLLTEEDLLNVFSNIMVLPFLTITAEQTA